jgi:hypothetical protein
MVGFLYRKRRQGKPIRWIAQKLGVTLVRAVAQAINRGLVMHTAYRGRRSVTPPPPDLEPWGQVRELPEENLCRWMNANPDEPWAMCARPTDNHSAWCPHHRAQVYPPRVPRRSNVSPLPPEVEGRGECLWR